VDTVKALDALGKWVVYSVQDDGFNVLNVADGNQETIFKLKDTIKEIKITSKEEIVILTSKRKKLHIFGLKSRALLREVPEFECYFGLNRLQVTVDSTKAVSFTDRDILISSLETAGQVRRISKSELFEENIDCTQLFSGDGVNLFAVGYDKVLRVYHLDKVLKDEVINQLPDRTLLSGTVSSVYPNYGDRYLPTKTIRNGQKELTIWDVKGDRPKRVRCLKHEEGINELRMCSPTRAVAKFFSEGGQNCGFGVLDLKEGKIERYLPGDANLLWSVGFTDDTHFMAFSREKRRLQVWNINKGAITFKHRFEKKQPISEALMNRDRSYVVCGLVRNEKEPNKSLPLIVFDCRNNKHHVLKIKKQQLTLHSASISHDGKFLVALTFDTVPTLWNIPSGHLLYILPTDSVHATGLSSRMNVAITCKGETDAVIQIWNIETGCILSQFDTQPTHKILVSEDETVAYTFQGNTFYAWDLLRRKRITSFTMDWAPIPRHVFSAGNSIVVPIPEAPVIMTLRLQGQGFDGDRVMSCDEAYSDVTVDGKLLLS
jgi:WD40 repeat protein